MTALYPILQNKPDLVVFKTQNQELLKIQAIATEFIGLLFQQILISGPVKKSH